MPSSSSSASSSSTYPDRPTASPVLLHHSSTRRKACTGCVKSKRRCDLRFPNCSRCMQRRVRCVYASGGSPVSDGRPGVRSQQAAVSSDSTTIPSASPSRLDSNAALSAASWEINSFTNPHSHHFPIDIATVDDLGPSVPLPTSQTSTYSHHQRSEDAATNLPDFDETYRSNNYDTFWEDELPDHHNHVSRVSKSPLPFLEDFDAEEEEMNEPFLSDATIHPIINLNGLTEFPPRSSASSSSLFIPSPWADQPLPVTRQIVIVSRDQLHFCKNELRSFISMLVQSGHTPFIHKILRTKTPLPTFTQDMYGLCALYLSKTPQNADLIYSILESKINALFEASNNWTTLPEWLFGLQALVMYQIIRLFDSDPRQRARGQRDCPRLKTWIAAVQEASVHLPTPDLHLRQRSPDEHTFVQPSSTMRTGPDQLEGCGPFTTWVVSECVRRSILMAHFVPAIYNGLRQGFCDSLPILRVQSMTLDGAGLWAASAESEWWHRSFLGARRASNVITYEEFVGSWSKGEVKEIGRFERVLLAVCRGRVTEGKFVLKDARADVREFEALRDMTETMMMA